MSTPWSNQLQSLVIVTAPVGAYAGIFIYSPAPGTGNLIGSWAAQAGTDPYGNAYPQGLNVTVGSISGATFLGTNFVLNSTGLFFYSGTPALGNLILSATQNAGTDSFGNAYLAGVASYAPLGAQFLTTALQAGTVFTAYANAAGGPWNQLGNIQANPVTGNMEYRATGGALMTAATLWYGFDPINLTAESWHDMRPLSNSFIGTITSRYPPQYRKSPDGFVDVVGFVQCPAGATTNFNSITFATVPAQYRPTANTGHKWPIIMETNVAPIGTPCVQIDTSGNFQFHNMPTTGMGSNILSIYGRYPLNGPITS